MLEGYLIVFKKTEQVYKIHINACNSTLSLAGQITATCSAHAKSLFFAILLIQTLLFLYGEKSQHCGLATWPRNCYCHRDNKLLENLGACSSSITFAHPQNIEVVTPNTVHSNYDACQEVIFYICWMVS